jgi:excisionase family DNA binding protein
MTRDWFTQQEVAERWNCSVRTVNRHIKSGDITAMRLGSMVRIDVDSVEQFERASLIPAGEVDLAAVENYVGAGGAA